ncbi:MAG: SAM-dependent methyltransferase [Planctomycetes bacterium]|jgi:23S rRNA (cytosine1962-C5)-methyltransferase|nr:SAM-dependent methyltransferase [Planctomycetota bacterium]MDP6408326.1 RsmD family RNA methyltransferase [Planctomycetota bacterium]
MPTSFEHPPFPGHALLDSGGGEKLERFGAFVLRRPDPQALWRKRLAEEWERADLIFVRESDRGGRWEPGGDDGVSLLEDGGSWSVSYPPARLVLRPTPFKHVGLFPEQATNWELVRRVRPMLGPEPPHLLNLFGYSGAASVLAAAAGWRVTHVDASRTALAWLRENLAASDLAGAPVRLLLEDALAFARRERRRGRRYEAILLDPPHHGRGPKGERWQLEDDLAELVEVAGALLAERSLLVLSTYAVGFSPLALENLLADLPAGRIEAGELALTEAGGEGSPEGSPEGGRPLPAGFCARWWRGIDLRP